MPRKEAPSTVMQTEKSTGDSDFKDSPAQSKAQQVTPSSSERSKTRMKVVSKKKKITNQDSAPVKKDFNTKQLIQHRCYINHYKEVMKDIELRESHISMIESSPFAHFLHFPDFVVDIHLLDELISNYKGNGRFLIGKKLVTFTVKDVSLILGLTSTGYKISEINLTKYNSEFEDRIFPDGLNLTRKSLEGKMRDLVLLEDEVGVTDFFRVWVLYVCATFLLPKTSYNAPRELVPLLDPWNKIKYLNWSHVVYELVMKNLDTAANTIRLRNKGLSKRSNTYSIGCSICLQLWLCEITTMFEPNYEVAQPRYKKWCPPVKRLKNSIAEITDEVLTRVEPLEGECYDVKISNKDDVPSVYIFTGNDKKRKEGAAPTKCLSRSNISKGKKQKIDTSLPDTSNLAGRLINVLLDALEKRKESKEIEGAENIDNAKDDLAKLETETRVELAPRAGVDMEAEIARLMEMNEALTIENKHLASENQKYKHYIEMEMINVPPFDDPHNEPQTSAHISENDDQNAVTTEVELKTVSQILDQMKHQPWNPRVSKKQKGDGQPQKPLENSMIKRIHKRR